MSARSSILGRIRQNAAIHDQAAREARVDARLREHKRNCVPERGQLDREGRIKLLRDILEAHSATTAEIDSFDQVPAGIADYLRRHNLAPELRTGKAAALLDMDWDGANLKISHGRAEAGTETSCSMAFGAVAESGTLILHSGGENPTSLNFLPDNHIIVVRAEDVMASYEEGWDRMRKDCAEELPRTVNYVSGPSRTGDIEQTILLGAHGPRRLHVMIVK